MATSRGEDAFTITNHHGLTVEVRLGDITEQTADAIVVPEGISFETLGFVGMQLMNVIPEFSKRRLELIEKEKKKKTKETFERWEVYTSTCKSKSKKFGFILHAIVTPPRQSESVDKWQNEMMLLYRRVFRQVDRKMLSDVVVPLMGTGRGGGNKEIAVQAAVLSVAKFKPPNLLKKVVFISIDPTIMSSMSESLSNLCSDATNPPMSTGGKRPTSGKKILSNGTTSCARPGSRQSNRPLPSGSNIKTQSTKTPSADRTRNATKVSGKPPPVKQIRGASNSSRGRTGTRSSARGDNPDLFLSGTRVTRPKQKTGQQPQRTTGRNVHAGFNDYWEEIPRELDEDVGTGGASRQRYSYDRKQDVEDRGKSESEYVQSKKRQLERLNMKMGEASLEERKMTGDSGFTRAGEDERGRLHYDVDRDGDVSGDKHRQREKASRLAKTNKKIMRESDQSHRTDNSHEEGCYSDEDELESFNGRKDLNGQSKAFYREIVENVAGNNANKFYLDRNRPGSENEYVRVGTDTLTTNNTNRPVYDDRSQPTGRSRYVEEGFTSSVTESGLSHKTNRSRYTKDSYDDDNLEQESTRQHIMQSSDYKGSRTMPNTLTTSRYEDVDAEEVDDEDVAEDISDQSSVNAAGDRDFDLEGARPKTRIVHQDEERLEDNDLRLDDEGAGGDEGEMCPICLDVIQNPKCLSKCGHVFCQECIEDSFRNYKPVCPSCNMVYGVLTGNQPSGTMDVGFSGESLPGYDGEGTITITYQIPDGRQTDIHPNPGVRYKGTTRVAYLPDCGRGRKVLKLLKTAFDRKLTFTIGRSTTTGKDNVVTWNDIHHKTNTDGGPTHFGYPDPDYLDRVTEELASKGVNLADIQ